MFARNNNYILPVALDYNRLIWRWLASGFFFGLMLFGPDLRVEYMLFFGRLKCDHFSPLGLCDQV